MSVSDRRRCLWGTVGLAAGLILGGCGDSGGRATILSYELLDEARLVLEVDACNAGSEIESVAESEGAVTVVVQYEEDTDDDCADAVPVELDAPLAGRVVVDGTTDAVVPRRSGVRTTS